jgi:hypothetical protein
MPKQIAVARMEGPRKRGRSHKIWKDEVEEDLNIMRIRHRLAMTRDRREWRKIVLEAKVHNGLYCLRRRGGGLEEEEGYCVQIMSVIVHNLAFLQYFWGDQIKQDQTGETCSSLRMWGDDKCEEKLQGKKSFVRHSQEWEDNIQTDL